jgi:DNA polymerase-3 subunit alpha
MLCIASSTAPIARSSQEWWIKPADHGALFSDVPEALANTLVVAQRTAFMPPKRKPILPSLAGDKEGEARMCADFAHRPGRAVAPTTPKPAMPSWRKPVRRAGRGAAAAIFRCLAKRVTRRCSTTARLEFEIGIINRMGFGGTS